jgi:hypothetical protein
VGDRLHAITNGTANVVASCDIFLINERAEWNVSQGSMEEAQAKRDDAHMQWLWDIADHSAVCLKYAGPTTDSEGVNT